MKNTCEIFASALRNRRVELGLTQRELADAIGYSEKAISKWERGSVIAPSVVLPLLAEVLKIDINRFFFEKMTEHYYLGVDGGGTKTDFVLSDSEGRIVNRVTLSGSNPNDIGFKEACEILTRGISEVCLDISTSNVYAFFGIAGGTTGDMKDRISAFLSKFGFAAYGNGNDAENAIQTALGDENGTIVILGTGSVAFSQIDGKRVRRGGYGYLFEDGGSGYSIGRDAIFHTLTNEEIGETSILCECVREILGATAIIPCLSEIYEGGKRRIAEFAPAVFRALDKGDSYAEEILDKNMASVARLIESTPTTDSTSDRQKIVVVGGITRDFERILPYIKKHLSNESKYDIDASNTPLYTGALRLARKIEENVC